MLPGKNLSNLSTTNCCKSSSSIDVDKRYLTSLNLISDPLNLIHQLLLM
jgi:hypothetical protein